MSNFVHGSTYSYTDPNGISKIISFVHPAPESFVEEPQLKRMPNQHLHKEECDHQEVFCSWKGIVVFVGALILIGIIICLAVGNSSVSLSDSSKNKISSKVLSNKGDEDGIEKVEDQPKLVRMRVKRVSPQEGETLVNPIPVPLSELVETDK